MTATLAKTSPEFVAPREAAPREYLWTADDFERACEAGAFGRGRRLELIQGKVIDRMSESPLHAFISTLIAECLRAVLSPRLLVRGEKPVRIAFNGDPVPDLSVIRGAISDYRGRHPSPEDVVLLVEVAITSADYDLSDKALLYARAGIGDYWVVLPEAGAVVVHRDPKPDGYGSVVRLTETDTVAPLAAPDVALAVRDLLGVSG